MVRLQQDMDELKVASGQETEEEKVGDGGSERRFSQIHV